MINYEKPFILANEDTAEGVYTASGAANGSGSVSRSGNMAIAHFDGRHLHSANNLTIYIDDNEKGSFDGGSTRSVAVTPGNHIIRFLVYNDSSEEAYWLGPFSRDFEAGKEYDIRPGKS